MAKYKAYPEYKDSGVEWLGEVPSHWEILSAKRMFQSVRTPAYKNDEQLAASQKYGVIPQSLMMQLNDSKVMLALKGTESFRHVEANNFVISLRSFEGGIEYSQYTGCVSPAYTVLKNFKPISYSYYRYLLKCSPFIAALQSSTDSLRDGKSINYEQFSTLCLPISSVQEQNIIATFLDHETAKIDNLIEKQQQLIELLKEKRQAVISHAVTKGLNPDVPMKDSGVEWLGKIPKDWQLKQIRHLCTSNGGGTPSKNNPNFWVGNIPWVSPKDMKFQYISDAEDHVSEDAVKQSSTKKIPTGSVLIVVRGMILAHSVPVAINTKVVTINQDMKALVPNENISCDYLHLVLSGLKRTLLELTDNSAHGTKCLRTDLFEKLWIPLPSLKQQKKIISEINEKVIKIDSLIHLQEEAKVLLQERRTALISAAVTGKIDVRDWVAPDTHSAEVHQEATA